MKHPYFCFSSREFTHRVKSVSMAKFTSEEVEALQNGGNQVFLCVCVCVMFFPWKNEFLFSLLLAWPFNYFSVQEKYIWRIGTFRDSDYRTAGQTYTIYSICFGHVNRKHTFLIMFPSGSDANKIRQFIKDVYVDRRYAGGKSSDKPPRDMQARDIWDLNSFSKY